MSSAIHYSEFSVPATIYTVTQTSFSTPSFSESACSSSPASTTISERSTTATRNSSSAGAPTTPPVNLTPHILSVFPGEELAIPTACENLTTPVPAYVQTRPKEKGLVDLYDTSTVEIKPSYRGTIRVTAHAVARSDHRDGSESAAWLRYSSGEPLWIVKEPLPPPPKNRRSKNKMPPCVIKMVSLRTGRVGLVSLQNVCLHPHAKVRGRHAVLFIPLGTQSPFTVPNNMLQSDTLTLSGLTREHPTLRDTKIILGINHRTLQYGYISASDITDTTPRDLVDWKRANLRPEPCSIANRRTSDGGEDDGNAADYRLAAEVPKGELALWVEVEDLVKANRRKAGIPEWRKKQLATVGEAGRVRKRGRQVGEK